MTDRKPIVKTDDPLPDPQAVDPHTVDPRRRRHDAKLEQIVAEAWTLARRDGLAAISLRDLGRRVDLRQPSLYAYFDSKLGLYDAMYADGLRQLLDAAAAHPPSDDPREALIEFVELAIRFSSEDVVRHQLLFERMIPGFKPSAESRRLLVQFREIAGARLAAVGVRDRDGGDIFTGIVSGFTQRQVATDPGGDRWLKLGRPAMEMFLAGVELRANAEKAPRARAAKKRGRPRT